MRSLAVLVLVLAAVHAPATAASAQQQTVMQPRTSLEAQVVRQLNVVRAARGLRPVHASPSLRTAARTHTRSMLDVGFFAHESPDGTAFSDRIRRYYTDRGWRMWSVGETLLASEGQELDATAIVTAWLNSRPHREIILSTAWRDVGIGAFYAPSAPRDFEGAQTLLITGDFGLRTGRTSGS